MSGFQIGLGLVFILASTANARFDSGVLNATKNWIDNRIALRINEFETVHNYTSSITNEIFTTILHKVGNFRLVKPKEIIADLEQRRSEFNQLIANVGNGNVRECKPLMDEVEKRAEKSIDRIRKCVDSQMEAVAGNVTEIQKSIRKGLDELNSYRERAVMCFTESTNISIISCLRAVRTDLYFKRRPVVIPMIMRLRSWEASVESSLFSCSAESLSAYYEFSSNLVTAVHQCIESNTKPSTISETSTSSEPSTISESSTSSEPSTMPELSTSSELSTTSESETTPESSMSSVPSSESSTFTELSATSEPSTTSESATTLETSTAEPSTTLEPATTLEP